MRKPHIGIFIEELPNVGNYTTLKVKLCYANGADVVVFSAKDIDYDKECINALVWTTDGYKREVTQFPVWVECSACKGKYREYFKDKCRIVDGYVLCKKDMNEALLKTEFSEYVIPSMYTAVPQNIISFLAMYKEIIVKPLFGARGEGILSLKTEGDNFIFTYTKGIRETLSYSDCIKKLTELYSNATVIVQPRLRFVNKDGNTMDFRINVCKGEGGKWQKMFIIPRTGRNNIVSNFSDGGYASLLKPTLEIDYGENAEKVLAVLESVAEKLPAKAQELSGCNLLSLGIDIGIDYETLKPYIIEINCLPKITFPDKAKYLSTVSDYFAYLSRNIK